MHLFTRLLLAGALICHGAMAHHHEQHNTLHAAATAAPSSLEQTMRTLWPGQLTLAAITTQQDIALVSWHYQAHDTAPRHGRALWRWQQGQWQLLSCAGRGLLESRFVEHAGVAPSAATALIAAHQKAEARLPNEEVQQFDSFMAVHETPNH